MTAMQIDPVHRVSAAVTTARAAVGSVAGERPWSMTAEQTVATLDDLAALESQVAELKARLLVQAESVDVHGLAGATSVASWLAHRYRLLRPAAHRAVRLATGLESHEKTRDALAEGAVNTEQAHAILGGLGELPDDLDPGLRCRAEEHLIGLAADHDARALENLVRHLLEVVAPEVADAHLARLLERSAAEDEDANRFHLWKTPQGRVRFKGDLDTLSGAALEKALFALGAPRHRASEGPLGPRRPTAERLGTAFAEYVRRYPADRLPSAGGLNATVVVLVPYETLIGGLKAARLDTGEHISAGLARRISCEAGIIPAVLGGTSEVLDLGRTRRFHSKAQRIKATIEQGGCLEEGCDAPPAFTHMHHPVAWSRGGDTNGDGWMLCPSAHRRVHDPRYTHERLPTGKIRFSRRSSASRVPP